MKTFKQCSKLEPVIGRNSYMSLCKIKREWKRMYSVSQRVEKLSVGIKPNNTYNRSRCRDPVKDSESNSILEK